MIYAGLGLLAVIVPIAIIVLVITAIVKGKNGNNKKSESFEEKVRVIYMYLIIIISLIMMSAGAITLFNSFMNLILPDTYSNINSIIIDVFTEMTILIVSIPLFIYHNNKVKE